MEPETEVAKFEMEGDLLDSDKKKEKKGKKEKKKQKKEVTSPIVEIPIIKKERPPEEEPTLKIEGLKSVKLRNLTQKILGCVVGESVTTEAPWLTINKQLIDENLDLHDESSDFLPIRRELITYKDPEVLVGYDPDFIPYPDEDFHRFYVAVTDQAKDTVLQQLAEERREAEERLKNSVNKTVLPWTTLGSEVEVDDSIPKNSRPLIELELETDIDELLKPVHFTDRNLEDAKDGYVRVGPGRDEFTGVRRIRVSTGVQAVPVVTQDAAQTDPGLPVNAWTQYVYDMETAQEAIVRGEVKPLQPDYQFTEEKYLEKALEYNETFDLYTNDYPLLVHREEDAKVPSKSFFDDYEAYTDVSHCKGKLISAIAWHPMWSGVVALSYSLAVRCLPATDIDPNVDEVTRDVFSRNPVLIWSFKDALKPRLILDSPREVYTIAWCPTDANILVGGCASGQIVIWDLSRKLEAVEGHEYLTPDQQRYRLVMHNLVGWMKPQPAVQYVRPAALSALQFSHAGRVSQIQWLSPYFELTDNGLFKRVSVDEGKFSMQIVSCSEDGYVMVWDLNRVPPDIGGKPKKKKIRKRPSALTINISQYKVYDRKFRPIYQMHPELPADRTMSMLLTCLSMKTDPVKYKLDVVEPEPIIPAEEIHQEFGEPPELVIEDEQEIQVVGPAVETEKLLLGLRAMKRAEEEEAAAAKEEKEVKQQFAREETVEYVEPVDSLEVIRRDSITFREIYKPVINPPDAIPTKDIQLATEEGDAITLHWEGFDFHRGEQITTEAGSMPSVGTAVHDEPVVAISRSPFMKDLTLTVGGKVMALWKDDLKNKPIFWKSCAVRLTSCSWSPFRPCMFHVGRIDGSLEVWDLMKRSDIPILVQSISGKVLTSMVEHPLPLHAGQSILGVADYNNSFRLLFFPDEFKEYLPDHINKLETFVQQEILLRRRYEKWNEDFLKKNAEELARQKAMEEEEEKRRKEAEATAEQEAQQRAKLEEEELKRLARGKNTMASITERYLVRMQAEREKQMQRVLMEKKRLDKKDLLAKQQPILMMKQMEKEKRKKQRDKIRQQQKIFDKTVAMLFPEVMEKPKEGPSRIDEFQEQLMELQPELMAEYDVLLPEKLEYIKSNPFNKRLKWEKVFEEGRARRNVLDFPLYLRQARQDRYSDRKAQRLYQMPPGPVPIPREGGGRRKTRVVFKEETSETEMQGEEGEGGEEGGEQDNEEDEGIGEDELEEDEE